MFRDTLAPEVWESLTARMTLRTYREGEVLVEQGTLRPDFHVIVDGIASIVLRRNQGGGEEVLGRLDAGDCVGEMSLLTGEPASADVVAATPVRALAIGQRQIAELGELRVSLLEALSAVVASRLGSANRRLLALRSARVRVVQCDPDDFDVIAALPAALAEVTGGRVLAIVRSDLAAAPGIRPSIESPRVTVTAVDASDDIALTNMLHEASERYDEIVVCTARPLHNDVTNAASTVRVLQRAELEDRTDEDGEAPCVVVTDEQWTQPRLAALSRLARRPVIGMLPPLPSGRATNCPSTQMKKLVRVITGRQIGVALGAGAAKGLAHLGVLRALDELDMPVDVISGCSIGAAVAACRAAGLPVDETAAVIERVAARALRPTLPLRSFLSNGGIRRELKAVAGDRCIEDMDTPLALVATDLLRRSEITFTSGLLWPRILASMALPVVYPPVAGMGSYLIDGGVLNPVPVRQCRLLGAGIVVAIRLTAERTSPRRDAIERPSVPLAVETLLRTFEIMHNRISEFSRHDADLTVEVRLDGGGLSDFKRGALYNEFGYEATMNARKQFDSLLARGPMQ